ncbi:hypothetical protein I0C86_25080 [Plantactinospora sp. S1510]|uniref:Condensation domain-containing protein n=1 Tax=Plantactinospora alkalitolerans TaxID=2789879 RepID=A0ABS0H158_9ACTN|nr:condensation domain-containing protein [Plantactinospora alkalitolerans]MBF9132198.1 hypothetical protein [Plantactinospora alkalitolerans]
MSRGQRWCWDIIRDLAPHENRTTLTLQVDIGSEYTVDQVIGVTTDAVTRFETLRTTYRLDGIGEPEQQVLGEGAFDLRLRQTDGQPPKQAAAALAQELAATQFDLRSAPPICFGLIMSDGRPTVLVVGLSNIAADVWSLTKLWRWLHTRLNDADVPHEDLVTPEWQPLDQVAYESGEQSKSVAAASLAFWREQLDHVRATPPPRYRPVVEAPRRWAVHFTSSALAQAAQQVAVKWGVPIQTVLLGGLAVMIGLRLGQPGIGVSLLTDNRHLAQTRRSLGRYAQIAPVYLDVSQETFGKVVSTTAQRMLRAARYGQPDPAAVAALTHGDDPCVGASGTLPVVFDFAASPGPTPATPTVDAIALRGLAVGTVLRWTPAADDESPGMFVLAQRFLTEVDLLVWVDTAYLSRADVAEVLLGAERLLIEVTAGDVPMCHLSAVTGVSGTVVERAEGIW